jgi:outer membrane protein OmpA-like peptidoglycan-associated protein
MNPSYPLKASALIFMSGLAVAACSESRPPSNATLDQASAAYDRVANDPKVVAAAHDEVESSRDTLNMAKQAWRDDADMVVVNHYAYLATQHAATAREQTKQRAAADQVAAMSPEIQDSARAVTLSDVLFGFERSDLNKDGQQSVAELAAFLKQHPDRTVDITGHTDSRGSAKYNEDLSAKRAGSVRQALIANGIDESRITARGMGPANPIASNNTHAGRQQNRRVEVVIAGAPGAAPAAYGASR